MLLLRQDMERMLLSVSRIWSENTDRLGEIDSRFGDGDHGVTIGKMARLMEKNLNSRDEKDIKSFLENLGDDLMGIGGGSAGPLYGTMIGGLAEGVEEGAEEIDGETIKRMLQSSLEAMREITNAQTGDKTMMDALIPAVEAARDSAGDIPDLLAAAMSAAEKGAKDSEQFASKFGRARSYKEQTIGTPDAGAISTSLFFRGLWEGLKEVR